VLKEATAKAADFLVRAQEVLSGDGSPADDELGIDNRDLGVEELTAVRGFGWQRVPIAGRTTSQDVADVDVFPLEAAGDDDLVEQLASGSDEGLTLRVLVGAGCFADEQETSLRVADAEDRLRPRASQFLTANAGGDSLLPLI
jgi:hypothetical protein